MSAAGHDILTSVKRRPMVSPLRYPGGKGALYPRLRTLIRESGLAGCTYVEPYAGGAGAGLSLLVSGQVERVVINDLDPAISAFWRTLVEDPEALIRRVQKVRVSIAEWRRQREIYRAGDDSNPAALGFATFFLNRTNRSGVLNGGPIGGHDQSGNYRLDARFNREALAERVRLLGLYSERISVSCEDGVEVIGRHASKPDTFIYADPPYFEKAGSLYMNGFTMSDHERLAKTLNRLAKRNWLLTYDDVDDVARLYPKRRRHTFELNYSAHRVLKATEVAISSDSLIGIDELWAN